MDTIGPMELIVFPLINLIHIYAIVCFLNNYFVHREPAFQKFSFPVMLISYLLIEVTALLSSNSLLILCMNLAGIFLLTVIYQSKFISKFVATVVLYIFSIALEGICLSLYSVIAGMNFTHIVNNSPVTMLLAAIAKLSLLAIAKMSLPIFETMKREAKSPFSLKYCVFTFFTPTASIFVIYVLFQNLSHSEMGLYVAVGISLMLLINFLVFYQYDLFLKESAMQQENNLLSQQNEMLMQHFSENAKSSEQIKKIHHDIKNITLAVLSEVEDLNLPNIGTIRDKFEALLDSMQWQNGPAQSGFAAVDVIINYKANFAAQNQIVVESKIKISEDYTMNNQAVAIILGNALDNAIEACMGVPPEERKIQVFILQKCSNLYISISNPYQGKIIFNDVGLPQTSKKRAGHGIGSKSIQTMVEDVGGYVLYDTENHIFKIQILLF